MLIHQATFQALQQGEVPSDRLMDEWLTKHLNLYEEVEPHVHAFVDEEHHADRISKETASLKQRYRDIVKPPLYGIPVAIKDLIHIDGWLTRAGSSLPPAAITGKEGSLVKTLRNKGALFAGKTVTEEFAYNGPIATRNPHNIDHSPGGSSAGSAAAVAAGLSPLGIGTQTLRSVIAPASFCGVVGFKPSYGRIPIDGVLVLAPSFDTVGLFTQDLASMEYAARHLVPAWEPYQTDYRKPVLGIPNGLYMKFMFDEVNHAFKEQIRKLEEAGCTVKLVEMPWEDEFIAGDAMLRLVQGEMARIHAPLAEQYLDHYGAPVSKAITTGQAIEEKELDWHQNSQLELRHALIDLQHKEGIDIWVSPSQGGTAPKWGEGTGWSGMTSIWSYMGCPVISIPSAHVNGLPLGFQCISSYGRDEELMFWSKIVSGLLNKS